MHARNKACTQLIRVRSLMRRMATRLDGSADTGGLKQRRMQALQVCRLCGLRAGTAGRCVEEPRVFELAGTAGTGLSCP